MQKVTFLRGSSSCRRHQARWPFSSCRQDQGWWIFESIQRTQGDHYPSTGLGQSIRSSNSSGRSATTNRHYAYSLWCWGHPRGLLFLIIISFLFLSPSYGGSKRVCRFQCTLASVRILCCLKVGLRAGDIPTHSNSTSIDRSTTTTTTTNTQKQTP